jgi:alpha-mannosidase
MKELEIQLKRFAVVLRDVVEPLVYPAAAPLEAHAAVFADIKATPPTPEEALKLNFQPVKPGWRWGPKWATAWFKVKGTTPTDFAGKRVVLRFSTATEGLVWRKEKTGWSPIHGLDVNRDALRLFDKAKGGEHIDELIEAACNHPFGVTGFEWDDPEVHARWNSADPGRFDRCEVAALDDEAWLLRQRFAFALGLLRELALESTRAGELIAALARVSNTLATSHNIAAASAILAEVLSHPAAGSATRCTAVGHAHLDTAWLWPIRETKRKCLRTFSNQLALMERYPDYRFLCSQAQQYAWVEQQAPALFEQVKKRVKEGRWEPNGAMWIEPDVNCVSGESLVRQIHHAVGYWSSRFGAAATQSFLFLPDTFGFGASLPQIMKLSGLDTFITNKLHWNAVNTFPHTTFRWRGIDGTEVLAHNTPGMDYNAVNTPKELRRGEATHKDKHITIPAPTSGKKGDATKTDTARWLQPFGYGDGGGGATDWSIQFAQFASNCDGLPRVTLGRADDFCKALHADRDKLRSVGEDFPLIDGELYLELHRGTMTTQSWNKRLNRECEESLRTVEWLAFAAPHTESKADGVAEKAAAKLDELWKLVLLNQFHDILPGSSIAWVYQDSRRDYAHVQRVCEQLTKKATNAWVGPLDTKGASRPLAVFNPASHSRSAVLDAINEQGELEPVYCKNIPALGVKLIDRSKPDGVVPVSVKGKDLSAKDKGVITLSNGVITVSIDARGIVTHLSRVGSSAAFDHAADPRVALNELRLFDDRPVMWDAWDIDHYYEESARVASVPAALKIVESSPLRVVLERTQKLGKASTITQHFILSAGATRLEIQSRVSWEEDHTLLRAAFSTGIAAAQCTTGCHFGHLSRPTTRNNSHERARFEFPAHGWLDLSERSRGIALLTRAKLGHSCHDGVIGLSLLRAPKHPDPTADRGDHEFTYALVPHEGDWRASGITREAESLNAPLFAEALNAGEKGSCREWSPFTLTTEGCDAHITAINRSIDAKRLIIRLHESHNARGSVHIKWNLPVKSVVPVDLLERPVHDVPASHTGDTTTIAVRPFQIITLAVTL